MRKTYTLVVGSNTYELESKVNELLEDGWRLTGVHQCSIAIQTVKDHPNEGAPYTIFTQALIRS